MEELPEELTIDILSRVLSVKTIIHCKCVCKKWRNLVSDSSFVNLHLSRSPTGLIVLHNPNTYKYMNDNWYLPDDPGILKWVEIEDEVDHHHLHHDHLMSLDLNPAPILPKTRMRQMVSVDGLICLWKYCPKLNLDETYICNPVTREIMILPRKRYQINGFVTVLYGFGVSSLTGEYKVVRIFQGDNDTLSKPKDNKPPRPIVLEAEIYTLGRGQWRSIGGAPYWLNGFHEFHAPFLNNHFHWIVCDEEDVFEKICTFDLDNETFQLFPSPPPESVQENRFHYSGLVVSKGCLCKFDTYDSELIIWVMKEYGIKESWHKEVVINRGISIGLEWPVLGPIRLIKGLKDGSVLMVFQGKLFVFDPRSQTIEDTKMFDHVLCGMAYCPSFLKLQNFESEIVQMF